MADTVSVSRSIRADPALVWSLVSDLPRMGEWSPETSGGRWLRGVTRPSKGARFLGHNRMGWIRWSTIATVVKCEDPTSFAFDISAGPVRVARWSYSIEPTEQGCEVTESWDDHRSQFFASTTALLMRVKDRAEHNERTMAQTLDALATAAEAMTDG